MRTRWDWILCGLGLALAVYLCIRSQNQVMILRLAIPQIQKELKAIANENERMQYEIDQFESPLHLMELVRKPEFSHLKSPYLQDIIIVPYEKHDE